MYTGCPRFFQPNFVRILYEYKSQKYYINIGCLVLLKNYIEYRQNNNSVSNSTDSRIRLSYYILKPMYDKVNDVTHTLIYLYMYTHMHTRFLRVLKRYEYVFRTDTDNWLIKTKHDQNELHGLEICNIPLHWNLNTYLCIFTNGHRTRVDKDGWFIVNVYDSDIDQNFGRSLNFRSTIDRYDVQAVSCSLR